MRRTIAALLMLCVTAATVNAPAGMHEAKAAEVREANTEETDILEAESVNDFKYAELGNNNIEIKKYKGSAAELVIPSEMDGKKVVKIGARAFNGCRQLESITIPKSIYEIEIVEDEDPGQRMGPFDDCENLKEIIVAEDNAWYSSQDGILYNEDKTTLLCCPAGKRGELTISESVAACYGLDSCRYLTEITVAEGNARYSSQDGILYNKDKTTLYCCPAGREGNVTIPDSVTYIGGYAFWNCSGLSNIIIPESVKWIGMTAFWGCQNLKGINVDERNESYSSSDGVLYQNRQEDEWTKKVLVRCPAGKEGSMRIPDGVTNIESGAFYDCVNLTSIMVPASVVSIGGGPDSGIRYEYAAFEGCSSLKEIEVDENNPRYEAFEGVLYYLYLSEEKELVFCPAGKEGSLAVPDGVTYISYTAFYDCQGITSITIPKSVTRIRHDEYDRINVFGDCSSLEEIIVEEENRSFSTQNGMLYDKTGTSLMCCPAGKQGNVVIAKDVENIRENAFVGCRKLTEISVDKSNRRYAALEGILYQKGNDAALNRLVCCPAGKKDTIKVAEGVQYIQGMAFADCLELKEIVIPSSVIAIYSYPFKGCSYDLCIRCTPGSYAEEYAKEWGMDYALIEKKQQTITAYDHVKAVGDAKFPIGADTDGNARLSYESSDASVVSVSTNGIVTIYGEGTARITITAAETAEYEAAQKVITITVNPASGENPTPPAEDLIGTSYIIGGGTYTITSVEPKEACFTSLNDEECTTAAIPRIVRINGIEYEVSSIGKMACSGKEALQMVVIGENVKEIGDRAFAGCTALKQVKIPESVQTIGEGAFEGCGDGLCIICARGSAAEAYAAENGIRHKASADEKEPQTIMAGDFEKTFGDGPFPIGASTDGDGALSYESDNEAVAVVSAKGTVILMGTGTARITIRASGTENYEPAEKTITITVNPKPGEDQNPGTGNNNQQNSGNKKAQTITAADIAKTYGDRQFPIGAGTDSGGTLSYTVKNPAVAAIDGNGTVTLKGCGRTEIVITAAAYGEYTAAEKTITLTVAPKKLKGISAKSTKAGTLTVKWKKDKAASGYIIECSTDRKFRKNVKTATIKKNKTTSKKMTKLKGGKRYYVRACAYAQAGGEKIKGAYTAGKKAVKVKK